MGGMITATGIGIFVIPLLYMLVRRHLSRKQPAAVGSLDEGEEAPAAPDDSKAEPA